MRVVPIGIYSVYCPREELGRCGVVPDVLTRSAASVYRICLLLAMEHQLSTSLTLFSWSRNARYSNRALEKMLANSSISALRCFSSSLLPNVRVSPILSRSSATKKSRYYVTVSKSFHQQIYSDKFFIMYSMISLVSLCYLYVTLALLH